MAGNIIPNCGKPVFFNLNARYVLAADTDADDLCSDANCLLDSTMGVLGDVCSRLDDPTLWAVLAVVKEAYSQDDMGESVSLMHNAVAILNHAASVIDDRALWGALYLLRQAHAAQQMAYRLN